MSDRRERQLEIVLKLNKLTKQGKIVWSQEYLPPSVGGVTQYVSEFRFRKYHLTDSPLIGLNRQLESIEPAKTNLSPLNFNLYIKGDVEDKDIWIPPMPALDDLASTVRHQVMKGDIQELDEVLRDLAEAENLLEG